MSAHEVFSCHLRYRMISETNADSDKCGIGLRENLHLSEPAARGHLEHTRASEIVLLHLCL